MRYSALLLASLALAWVAVPAARAHEDHGAPAGVPPEQLGEVTFAVSCSDAAQGEFNRAMALFHSFWFDPA